MDVELISRATAIEQIKRMPYWFTHDGYCALTYDDVEAAVNNAPAVDAVPVVHGRWYDKGSISCRCSCCGCKSNKEYNYCPHCGAKMDGERRDSE